MCVTDLPRLHVFIVHDDAVGDVAQSEADDVLTGVLPDDLQQALRLLRDEQVVLRNGRRCGHCSYIIVST